MNITIEAAADKFRLSARPAIGIVTSVTGADGAYSIKVTSSVKTLVFSYVGYSDVEAPVTMLRVYSS